MVHGGTAGGRTSGSLHYIAGRQIPEFGENKTTRICGADNHKGGKNTEKKF